MAKRGNSDSCILVPQVNDEPSELYVGLLDKHVDRPLVNLVYAKYLTSNAPALMDAAGYSRNYQGEHSAADVYKFFKISSIQNAQGYSIGSIEEKYGVVNKDGSRKAFSSDDAFSKAKNINTNDKGFVAHVVQRGDVFNVIVDKRDSRTLSYESEVDRALAEWNALDNGLSFIGIDTNELKAAFPDLVNPLRVEDFLSYMRILDRAKVNTLNERDIKMLLLTGKNYPKIKTLLNRGWGNIDEIVSKTYDVLSNPSNYQASLVSFVKEALAEAQRNNLKDFDAIRNTIKTTIVPNFNAASEAVKIETKLKELDKKYGINSTIIVRTDNEIRKLSDAAAEAIMVLQRQLRYLEQQSGRTTEGMEIEKALDDITKQLEGKKYYTGLLNFLSKANHYATIVDNMLRNIPTTGTVLEHSVKVGSALAKARTLRDGYYALVNALTSPESLVVDENISQDDLNNLKESASKVKEIMDSYEKKMTDMRNDMMLDVSQEILGDSAINGKPLADILKMADADSSIMDFLYSCERVSDPIISVLGTIIRDTQRSRDKRLTDISYRIRVANDKLRKAGYDSRFMYEYTESPRVDWDKYNAARKAERKRLISQNVHGNALQAQLVAWTFQNTEQDPNTGKRIPNNNYRTNNIVYYIRSNYDWTSYNTEKSKYRGLLKKQGLTGFALRDEMEKWEAANTEEIVVDSVSGRTERVPGVMFRKSGDFRTTLSQAQLEYYDTMMQIKGEIGTLLPSYAQKQFLPPQRRASWIEIVDKGVKGELTAKEVALNLLDRMNPLKIRQDDTNYIEGGIVVGEDNLVSTMSDYNDTILRRIPLYYVNKLRDQKDLTFDFSGAVQSLAATAINYDAIYTVKDMIEEMADFIKMRAVADQDSDGNKRYDIVKWGNSIIGKAVRRKGESTNTSSLVDGFISKHLYNEQLARGNRKVQLAVQALVNYTSINQLAPNVKGALSNYLVGEAQMLIEGGAREYYGVKNYINAHAIMYGEGIRMGTVMDHLANNTTTLGHLLEERFDPLQEIYTELGGKRYLTGFKKLFGGFNVMGMYSAGESLIHLTNMYAVLDAEKVLFNGKKVSLYKAFDRQFSNNNENAKLIVKQGFTRLDGSAITDEYLNEVANKIRLVNQRTHGSMNTEDKGLIHRHMAGRAVMNFKQWMVEHYSRRYRGRYFDGTTRTWQEGYYNTVYKFGKEMLKDLLHLECNANARWNELDTTQKANVRRALSEVLVLFSLLGMSRALGDPKDHKGEWGYRMLIYQIRRLILDESASVPPIPAVTGGVLQEGINLVNSPVASVKTINGILYPLTGMGEIDETYKVGRHKGKNKYLTKIKKNTIPFYGQIDQLLHMDDEDYIFNVFGNIAFSGR